MASRKHGQCVSGPDCEAVIDLMNEFYCVEAIRCGSSTDDIVDIEVCRIKIVPIENYRNSKTFEVYCRNGDEYNQEPFFYTVVVKWICTHTFGLTPEKKFKKACRHAVQQDNDEFKQRYFIKGHNYVGGYINWRAQCQECGGVFPYGEMDVDHQEPYFVDIIRQFIHINNIDMERIRYDDENIQSVIFFKDESLVELFRTYHTQHANLRVVCKKCNNDPKSKPVRNNERKQRFIAAAKKAEGLSIPPFNELDNTEEKEQFLKLLEAAEQGDTDAQYEVAKCYQFGMGVEQDHYKCFLWLCEYNIEAAQAAYPNMGYSEWETYNDKKELRAPKWEHEEFKPKRYHRQPSLFDQTKDHIIPEPKVPIQVSSSEFEQTKGNTAPEPARPIVQRRLQFN